MKKIITTNMVENVRRQPFNQASYDHIQEAFQEGFTSIMKLLSQSTGVILLYGCIDSDAGATSWNLNAGAAVYNGEIFLIDAFTGSHASQVPVLTIETTYRAGDPVGFSDGNSFNVHEIRKLKWAMAVAGTGVADFSQVVRLKTQFKNAAGVDSEVTLKTKLIEIGDWNMDTTATITKQHGLDYTKIYDYNAIIFEDTQPGLRVPIATVQTGFGPMGSIYLSGANDLVVSRELGSLFDSTTYNSTSFNRGIISIRYWE